MAIESKQYNYSDICEKSEGSSTLVYILIIEEIVRRKADSKLALHKTVASTLNRSMYIVHRVGRYRKYPGNSKFYQCSTTILEECVSFYVQMDKTCY